MTDMMTMLASDLPLPLIGRGKVRDGKRYLDAYKLITGAEPSI